MPSERMSRNDFILLAVFVSTLLAIVLVAFAPVADEATLTMRVWAIAGSPIAIGVVSTFVAAFAGTLGAQALAERTTSRKALLSEIRGVNAALGVVFTITNTYITVKKQYVNTLVRDHETQAAARKAHAGALFAVHLELQTISPPFSPIDELRTLLRERITPDGGAMFLLTPLTQRIRDFDDAINKRNDWIAEVKAMPSNSDSIKCAWFFGVPYDTGRTDARYPNLISAFKSKTDDCIAFSILIGQSLARYGERLAKRYGDDAPRITKASFDQVADILPDMSLYSGWSKQRTT